MFVRVRSLHTHTDTYLCSNMSAKIELNHAQFEQNHAVLPLHAPLGLGAGIIATRIFCFAGRWGEEVQVQARADATLSKRIIRILDVVPTLEWLEVDGVMYMFIGFDQASHRSRKNVMHKLSILVESFFFYNYVRMDRFSAIQVSTGFLSHKMHLGMVIFATCCH